LILVARAITGSLGANPVQTLTLSTGDWTMRLLLGMLCVTPVARMTGWKKVESLRRPLGLYTLFYACLHFMIYFGLDYLFNVGLIVQEAPKTPFVIVGFGGFLLLILLGITSLKAVMRRMNSKRWKIIHRLVYLFGIVGLAHYLLKVKIIPVELILYASVLVILLLFRLVWFLIKRPTGKFTFSPEMESG
jgi:sulfoxide reductase heme-binding subunit YedZ